MGKPMRPDTAMAFDQLAAAAHKAGILLSITSAFRSDAEQAKLFAAHPDPKWVAPPGHSLHRNGTDLDLGPPSAYQWLARNAPRFGFIERYGWEPWHFGYVRAADATGPSGATGARGGGAGGEGGAGAGGDGGGGKGAPAFLPARYRDPPGRASNQGEGSG